MAFLGLGDYLCEACKHFDTDGNDGNHPSCAKQGGEWSDNPQRAIPLGEECPYGYEFGVPGGYPVSMERNERRAKEVRAMMELGPDTDQLEPEKGPEECQHGGGALSTIETLQIGPHGDAPVLWAAHCKACGKYTPATLTVQECMKMASLGWFEPGKQVEPVRCHECRYSFLHMDGRTYCDAWNRWTELDGWCHKGRRKPE